MDIANFFGKNMEEVELDPRREGKYDDELSWTCGTDGENPWMQLRHEEGGRGFRFARGCNSGDTEDRYDNMMDAYYEARSFIENHYRQKDREFPKNKTELNILLSQKKKEYPPRWDFLTKSVRHYKLLDYLLTNWLWTSKTRTWSNKIIDNLDMYGLVLCKLIHHPTYIFILPHTYFIKYKVFIKSFTRIKNIGINSSKKKKIVIIY